MSNPSAGRTTPGFRVPNMTGSPEFGLPKVGLRGEEHHKNTCPPESADGLRKMTLNLSTTAET